MSWIGYELIWVDLGTSWFGYELIWVDLGMSWFELIWVRVDLGTSWLRYELTWVWVDLGTSWPISVHVMTKPQLQPKALVWTWPYTVYHLLKQQGSVFLSNTEPCPTWKGHSSPNGNHPLLSLIETHLGQDYFYSRVTFTFKKLDLLML